MQIIGGTIAALLFSTNLFVAPARSLVPAGVCGEEAFVATEGCALTQGDSCRDACDATDWSSLCYGECCQAGADYGEEYGECDPNCQAVCEYNRWGDCYFTWCDANSVLFCDEAPVSILSDATACSKYVCDHALPVDGVACGHPR